MEATFNESIHLKAAQVADMVIKKQLDYGKTNILDAPGGPDFGILGRLWDKVSRLKNLVDVEEPNYESVKETYLDIVGYGLIGLMIEDGSFGSDIERKYYFDDILDVLHKEEGFEADYVFEVQFDADERAP